MIAQAENVTVLCAGSLVLDTIIRPVDEPRWGTTTLVESMDRHVGGNGANTARALSLLGTRVRLLGTLGDDEAGAFVRHELQSAGVDTSEIQEVPLPTAATAVLVSSGGDRQFLHRLGASTEAFRRLIDFTPRLCGGATHFHLASFFVLPELRIHGAEILRRARAAGLSTSLDVNWDAKGEWIRALGPCVPYVDILFLNEDESRMLTHVDDPLAAARQLQGFGAALIVQKLSRAGCLILPYGPGAEAIRCAAYEVECVDTTGAGDCFAAGFLRSHLAGLPLADSAECGNAAGALSVSRVGAVAGLPTEEEFEAWRKTAPRKK